MQMEDWPAWHFDKRGVFSVKSEYQVYIAEVRGRRSDFASGSNTPNREEDEVWAKLWKLQCPGKIKHFLWRVAHNTVAFCRNLRRRGMDVQTVRRDALYVAG